MYPPRLVHYLSCTYYERVTPKKIMDLFVFIFFVFTFVVLNLKFYVMEKDLKLPEPEELKKLPRIYVRFDDVNYELLSYVVGLPNEQLVGMFPAASRVLRLNVQRLSNSPAIQFGASTIDVVLFTPSVDDYLNGLILDYESSL